MNYLAQGLTQGFQIGADAYQAKKRRQFEKEQADALKALREKQLDFEISNANRSFNRQVGRDQAEDIRNDRGFAFQVSSKQGDDAFRENRATAEDTRNDRQFGLDSYRVKSGVKQGDRQLDQAAAKLAFEKQVYGETQGPGSPAFALPAHQAQYYQALAGSKMVPNLNESGSPSVAMFGAEYEGKIVKGPDGNRYLIQNGVPIRQ